MSAPQSGCHFSQGVGQGPVSGRHSSLSWIHWKRSVHCVSFERCIFLVAILDQNLVYSSGFDFKIQPSKFVGNLRLRFVCCYCQKKMQNLATKFARSLDLILR